MRVRRRLLVSKSQSQVFHVISRVVNRDLILEDEEKGAFLDIMRRMEAFCGVEVLSFCLMGNHFHILLHVPTKPKEIPVSEIWERMEFIYSKKKIAELRMMVDDLEASGRIQELDVYWDKMRARMYDLSVFVQEIKQRFSKYYNKLNERKGTLWEDRFKSLMVEPKCDSLLKIAAYIELNPLRAGLVDKPGDYQWSSYGEAEAGGNKSRKAIMNLVTGLSGGVSLEDAMEVYQSYLVYSEVRKKAKQNKEAGLTEPLKESDAVGASFRRLIRGRVRPFSDGLVVGSKGFIERFYQECKEGLNPERKTISHPVNDSGVKELYSYRNVEN